MSENETVLRKDAAPEDLPPELLAQLLDHHNPVKVITPGMPELLRNAAAQGAVLLENRVLPFRSGSRISVFGRVQLDWFCTGYGSGGDVNYPYLVNLLEGLRRCDQLQVNETLAGIYETWVSTNPASNGFWGDWPRSHPEMALTDAVVAQAAEESDNAVIVIGRASGEDRENALEPGSYYLTDDEKEMLRRVTARFPDAVLVLNIGSIMDLSFVREYSLGGVMILWQGGMESGNAAADLLCGKVTPSGHLTDTVALRYEDYPSAGNFGGHDSNEYQEDIYVGYRWFETFAPERVLYPFGHGLSYTSFSCSAPQQEGTSFKVRVANTGSCSGRQVLMLFVQKPCGVLGNPARVLTAFAKTKLLSPGESQELTLTADPRLLASYDDSGLTGHRNCYVMEPGQYRFYLGENVRSAAPAGSITVDTLTVTEALREAAAPQAPFPILAAAEENGTCRVTHRTAAARQRDLRSDILAALPASVPQTGDLGIKLADVQSGKASLDSFIGQLDHDELEAISRGGYNMNHPLGARGNAGIFGGVTESLREKGVPPIVTTDGPSGIRLYDSCSLLPIGTLLACSFDPEMVSDLLSHLADEMIQRGSDVLLAPGMNIHRNPLCGRNFEYYSEDPLVSGRIAAAAVRGLQSRGVSACPKHFACNSQEYNRNRNDSIVSQRALREIYLKGFELCVKDAAPLNLMTCYNKVNGVWGHYHFELVQNILREEWGYDGNVMTDWWMQPSASPEFPEMENNGYRVRARVDVLMPGSASYIDQQEIPDGTLLATCGKPDGITLGEMQLAARHVLQCVLRLKKL